MEHQNALTPPPPLPTPPKHEDVEIPAANLRTPYTFDQAQETWVLGSASCGFAQLLVELRVRG